MRFAHYEVAIESDGSPVELGRGAMGITYRAMDSTLRRSVALKVVAPQIACNPAARARFLREARAAAGLRHPHVATVFFFGERVEDLQLFYAMELIEGETLQARIRRAGSLPATTVLQIGAQVADALAAAESCQLTHRDLKPANLMLVDGESVNVKVIDFGLAKAAVDDGAGASHLTGVEDFIGTPAFASPEHFNHWQDIDARSDFYALATTLWYALTGKTPFGGRTPAEIHQQQLHGALPLEQLRAARVPPALVALLRSLLSPDPTDRPQTARELSAAIARCSERVVAVPSARPRQAVLVSMAVIGLLLAAAAAWVIDRRASPPVVPLAAEPPALEKSIAVLPFDNLSVDKNNAFFANGIQDEILTYLARIADLKVISRTSVLSYGDPAKRLPAREIGHALGVAYLLEGSVQREGNRVHLAAQLIDAARDRTVWAESFDRDLADVFAIQSEVANTIVTKLRAQLSGSEQVALNEPPTHDFAAYELFLHAKELMNNFDPSTSNREPLFEGVRLLDEATARDPDFYEAWSLLTYMQGNLLRFKVDPTPQTRIALAEKALANVRRLRPYAGETHFTAGLYYYTVHDPDHGRPEIALARQTLPNNWRLLYTTATTSMVDGHWADALEAMKKARAVNPRNFSTLSILMLIYSDLRRYDDAARVAEDAIAAGINPDQFTMRHALVVQNQTGDTSGLHAMIRQLVGQSDPADHNFLLRLDTAMRDRDFDEAARVIAADPRQEFTSWGSTVVPRTKLTGRVAYARGDLTAARKDYDLARPVYERAIRDRPLDPDAWTILADIDARLGRTEDSLREGWHAVALCPISREGVDGPGKLENVALYYAMAGDKDRALTILESMENVPGAFDYGYVAKHPDFDELRGEPRFDAFVQAIREPVDLSKFNPANFPPPASSPTR